MACWAEACWEAVTARRIGWLDCRSAVSGTVNLATGVQNPFATLPNSRSVWQSGVERATSIWLKVNVPSGGRDCQIAKMPTPPPWQDGFPHGGRFNSMRVQPQQYRLVCCRQASATLWDQQNRLRMPVHRVGKFPRHPCRRFRRVRAATGGLLAAPWTPASLSLLPESKGEDKRQKMMLTHPRLHSGPSSTAAVASRCPTHRQSGPQPVVRKRSPLPSGLIAHSPRPCSWLIAPSPDPIASR